MICGSVVRRKTISLRVCFEGNPLLAAHCAEKKNTLLKIFFFKNASETKEKSTTVRVNVDWLKEVKAEVVHRLAELSTT